MSEAARRASLARMQSDLRSFHIVEITTAVTTRVHELLGRHPLRAADAIQLAAALLLASSTGAAAEFVVYDERLAVAARFEGLRVLR